MYEQDMKEQSTPRPEAPAAAHPWRRKTIPLSQEVWEAGLNEHALNARPGCSCRRCRGIFYRRTP